MRKRMRGNVTRQGESIFNNEDFQSSNSDATRGNNNNNTKGGAERNKSDK